MYDRILERPPVVVRYSAKERPRWQRTRDITHGGGRSSREKYVGETFSTTIEIPAEMVEHYRCRRAFNLFPGRYGPHDGLIRKPLYQEDTCLRSEYTTSHQYQSRISELNRIW